MPLDNDDLESDEETSLPNRRIIKDPVHGYLEFDSFVCKFIDTRQFQRLRHLKQLGTSYFVWPGASHNRFEHCLGVAHLAQAMVEHLARNQPKLGITSRDIRCVTLAGLCHDLGHGPFSHVFDSQFIPKARPGIKWEHEDGSEMMVDAIVKENVIEIPEKDVDFIKDLIQGKDRHPEHQEKSFLFQIVANKVNGVDVDKFDYIARDTHQVGEKANLEALRLIHSSRVIGRENICFHSNDIYNVFLLFHTRWNLHQRVYSHKTSKAIEYMVVDALLAADSILDISGRISDPERYLYLTDSILEEIERSTDPRLKTAREIILRIRRRDLYRCVDYLHVGVADKAALEEVVTAQEVVRKANEIRLGIEGGEGVREVTDSDVIIDWSYLHFGMRERDPVENVLFYGKGSANKACKADKAQYSQSVPTAFAEYTLRVYTRDGSLYGLVQNGYRAIQQQWQQQATSPAEAPFPQTSELSSQSSLLFQPSNFNPSGVGAVDPKTPSHPSVQLPGTDMTGSGLGSSPAGFVSFPANPYTTVPVNYQRGGAVNESPKSTAAGSRKRPRGVETTDDGTLEGMSEGNLMKRAKRDSQDGTGVS